MIVYRCAHAKYATDLSGVGAAMKGGRWNTLGIPVIYTSESISLFLLEIIANATTLEHLQQVRLMEIHLPDFIEHEIKLKKLKKQWFEDTSYSQFIGTEVLKSNNFLAVKCPSAIVPTEFNYLINPRHKDIAQVKIDFVREFHFDKRLFKNAAKNA